MCCFCLFVCCAGVAFESLCLCGRQSGGVIGIISPPLEVFCARLYASTFPSTHPSRYVTEAKQTSKGPVREQPASGPRSDLIDRPLSGAPAGSVYLPLQSRRTSVFASHQRSKPRRPKMSPTGNLDDKSRSRNMMLGYSFGI